MRVLLAGLAVLLAAYLALVTVFAILGTPQEKAARDEARFYWGLLFFFVGVAWTLAVGLAHLFIRLKRNRERP